MKRGYPETLLQQAISKVAAMPRESTLNYKQNKQNERVPVVITHNPGNPPIAQWLKDYMPILHSSSRMKKAAPEPPIVGERNCKNLRNILMPSKLPKQQQSRDPMTHQSQTRQQQNGCFKCSATRCVLCKNHLLSTTSFHSVTNGARYFIKSKLSCNSTNLVYLIDCAKCGKVQYVGETGQTLKKRFYGHRHNIQHFSDSNNDNNDSNAHSSNFIREDTMVAKHFNQPGHTIDDMKCAAIEQIFADDAGLRKRREKFWRHQLQTNFPDGLNVFD